MTNRARLIVLIATFIQLTASGISIRAQDLEDLHQKVFNPVNSTIAKMAHGDPLLAMNEQTQGKDTAKIYARPESLPDPVVELFELQSHPRVAAPREQPKNSWLGLGLCLYVLVMAIVGLALMMPAIKERAGYFKLRIRAKKNNADDVRRLG